MFSDFKTAAMSVKHQTINPMITEDFEEFCGEEMKPFVALKVEEEKNNLTPAEVKNITGQQSMQADAKSGAKKSRFAFRAWLNGLFNAGL